MLKEIETRQGVTYFNWAKLQMLNFVSISNKKMALTLSCRII